MLTMGLSQPCSLAWGRKAEWDHLRGLAPLSHTKHVQIHSRVTKEFRLSRDTVPRQPPLPGATTGA